MQRSYGNGSRGAASKGGGDDKSDGDSKNSKSPMSGGGKNTAKDAIEGVGGNKNSGNQKNKENNNTNQNNGKGKGNDLITGAINGSKPKTGDYDDIYD